MWSMIWLELLASLKRLTRMMWKRMHKSAFNKRVDELLSTIYSHEKDFKSPA